MCEKYVQNILHNVHVYMYEIIGEGFFYSKRFIHVAELFFREVRIQTVTEARTLHPTVGDVHTVPLHRAVITTAPSYSYIRHEGWFA